MKKRQPLRGYAYAGIILLVSLCDFSGESLYGQPIAPGSENYYTIETDHFYLHYPSEHLDYARKLARIAERIHAELEPRYKSNVTKTHVVLVFSSDIVNAFATVYGMDLVYLFLRSPRPGEFSRYDLWMEKLFRHEYTHILNLRPINGPLQWVFRILTGIPPNFVSPMGFIEGFAVYEESSKGKGRYNDPLTRMIIRTAVYENKFPSIEEILTGSHRWPYGNHYYLYGARYVGFLRDRYGSRLDEYFNIYGMVPDRRLHRIGLPTLVESGTLYREREFEEFQNEINDLQNRNLTREERLTEDGNLKRFLQRNANGDLYYFFRPVDRPSGIYQFSGNGSSRVRHSHESGGFSVPEGLVSDEYYDYPSWGFRYELYDMNRLPFFRRIAPGRSIQYPVYLHSKDEIVFIEKTDRYQKIVYASFVNRIISSEEEIIRIPLTGILDYLTVSPDENHLAFIARETEIGYPGLYICDIDSLDCNSILITSGIVTQPSFSLDSRRVYFTSDISGIYNYYSVDLDGKNARKHTEAITGFFYPVESENGLYGIGYYQNGFDLIHIESEELLNQEMSFPRRDWSQEKNEPIDRFPVREVVTSEPYKYNIAGFSPFFTGIFQGPTIANFGIAAYDALNRHHAVGGLGLSHPDPYLFLAYNYSRYSTGFSGSYLTNFIKNQKDSGCDTERGLAVFICDSPYLYIEEYSLAVDHVHQGRLFNQYYALGFQHRKLRNAKKMATSVFDARDLNHTGPFVMAQISHLHFYPESVSPEHGFRLFASASYYSPEASKFDLAPGRRYSFEYSAVETGLTAYLPSLWSNHVNYLSFRGYGTIGPDGDLEQVRLSRLMRGLDPDLSPFNRAAVVATYEYRLPIYWFSRRIIPAYPEYMIRGLGLYVFAETGTTFDREIQENPWTESYGLTLVAGFNLLYIPLDEFRVTVARGRGPAAETQVSLAIGIGLTGPNSGQSRGQNGNLRHRFYAPNSPMDQRMSPHSGLQNGL